MSAVLTLAPFSFGATSVMNLACRKFAVTEPNYGVKVPYAASVMPSCIPNGVNLLNEMLKETHTDEKVIVFGWSQGCQVAGEWLLKYGNHPDAPNPERLSFILIGNPTNKHGHPPHIPLLTGHLTPDDTQYKVLDIARKWDGWANWSWNPRSAIGMFTDHTMYFNVDINNLQPINQIQVGNTTYAVIP